MGNAMEFGTLTRGFLWLVVLICIGAYILKKKRKFKLPPGPIGLPILGYLPYMGSNSSLELQRLSKKYGDIYSLYLGTKHVVVVTDALIAKQILSSPFAIDRPKGLFLLLPGGGGFAEASGADWKEQRRYSISEMKNLGFGRSDWEKLVEMEVSDFLDVLAKSEGQPIDIYWELSASVSNNIVSLVTSKRLPMGDPRRKIIDHGIESFEILYDQSGLASSYPRLFKLLAKFGILNVGRRLEDIKAMNRCIGQEIYEQKHKEGHSYIHNYFAEIEKNKQLNLENSFNVDNLIGNVQALIMAGSDTTKVSILWLFLAMASFPDIQDKVQEEIDKEIGKDGTVEWVDRKKLPYCHATILEGQRWRTVAPLSLQHRTSEDIVISGYDIPKGTDIITVLSAFHSDTKYWKDPEAFQPERFLSENGITVKEPEAYMPFSHGKRICPGKTVAFIEIFHYFVATMQKFRIFPASETMPPDLVGFPGLTLQPKQQKLRFVRL